MMMNEEIWAGELGNEYVDRNLPQQAERQLFWQPFFEKYPVKNLLEIGCGTGLNLWNIPARIDAYGIDINARSLEFLPSRIKAWCRSMYDLPFKDNVFDITFTMGVLIHSPPEHLLKAMSEIVRCSRKYVLCGEYYAESERERPFLGKMGITWERPYGKIYLDNFDLRLIDKGVLTEEMDFNNINWWLFEK